MSIFGTAKPSFFEVTAVITISNATYSNGYITIITSASHGIVTNEWVYITDIASGMTDANGIWEIIKIDATSFKFLKTTGQSYTSGGNVRVGYKFMNSIFEFDLVQPVQLNPRSIITGVKTNTHLGDYGSFKITERLWQKATDFTAKLRFQRLNGFYHTNVWFLPHGVYSIKDSGSNTVACYFKGFKPMYYRGFISYDAVICEFETNKYHDVTKLLV